MNTTLFASRPNAAQRDSQPKDHLDGLRETLTDSIARVRAERDRIRAARDSIPPLQRRFDSEGHHVWLQLDDWLIGLDAALTDAPDIAEESGE